MTVVIGVGGPKGGVGKTTLALNLATHCAREHGLGTVLVDTDANRSALHAATAAGEAMPFEVAASTEPEELRGLRGAGFDLVVVDLPGSWYGPDTAPWPRGEPFDLLALPSRPELMDLRPLLSFVDTQVHPSAVPYLIGLTRVHRDRVRAAESRREELRSLGYRVAGTYTRTLVAHDDALELGKPVYDLPGGRHSTAAAASREYRSLIAELLAMCGLRYGPDGTPVPAPRLAVPQADRSGAPSGNASHAC